MRRDAGTRGSTRRRAIVVAGLVTMLALHLAVPTGVLGQVTYLVVTVGGAALAIVASRRMPGRSGRAWRLVAGGLTASALADVYWSSHELLAPPVPFVTVGDIGWLGSYPLLIGAMFLLLRGGSDGARDDLEGLIDSAAAVVVSVLVIYPTIIAPIMADPTSPVFHRLVWSSYPVLDAVLLALVARMMVSRRSASRVSWLLAAGVLLWLTTDLAASANELYGTALAVADLGWMFGAALIGFAAWSAAGTPRDAASGGSGLAVVAARISPLRIAASVLPLLAPVGLELWSHSNGTDSPVLLAGGTAVLAVLVGARTLLFLRTRDEAERRLRSSERYYKALAANSADAVLVLDATGVVISESPHLAALVGRPDAQLRGLAAINAVSEEHAPSAVDLFMRALGSPGTVHDLELQLRVEEGPAPWLAVRAVNLLDDPDVRGIVVNFHEISDRKSAEEELVHLAFHDSLTGLANRALFQDRVDHVVETRGLPRAAVLFLDLDGFKDVNDGFGHDAGDALLCEVARRLSDAARAGDTVARLGGDEFAVLLEGELDPRAGAVAVADRILRDISKPVLLADGLVTVTVSIGIATPSGGATASSLLRDADVAMYEAKSGGRNRWVQYAPAMRTATLERLKLTHDLAGALEQDQLRVVYQPVVELSSGTIVGFEALLRWDHPELGCIAPDRFIPIAEECGLINSIGAWVLETACHRAAIWRTDFDLPDLTMAVNVSARQLASSDLVSHVEEALARSALPARALVLEMTESVLVADPIATAGRLRQLRRLGLRLAIDDFGTGYSSLSYLRQFPVNILKIDRSFISTLTADTDVPPILHGMLELGHTLGMELVAEGIETAAQLGHLQDERCDLGQGYLFSPPVDDDAVLDLLATHSDRRHAAPTGGD